MKRKSEKELLCQQMKLLAEESKNALPKELPELANAMCEIYKTLKSPSGHAAFGACFFFISTYFVIRFLVHVQKLLRAKP